MDSGSASSGGTSEPAKPEAAATTATSPHPGCGCAASASASSSSSSSSLTVRVTPTTGGQFDLQASKTDTVETLKKLISKKLKVPKERICLLHRDRQLREGTLQENQLVDGSRLTLLPSVETGLLAQRPEQSVMQALESLNDSQVNDFLSGKAPLNLTMRLGDHMMLIQLQLSTVTPSGGRRSGASPSTSGASSTSRVAAPAATTSSPAPAPAASRHAHSHAPATSSSTAAASKPSPSPSSSSAAPEICRCDSSSSASGPASAAAAAARPTLDTRALAEASRNLTQTLKQLSSEDNARARRQGAIIESMHHHGKGVYSGTFSGTLNPALQDRFGRPKRDISTIIHILNDLLCATPQYRRHASRTQQQQQQQQQQPQQQQHHHHHHHHQQQQHHHQQHQQHAAGSHASTSAAVASPSAVAAAGAGASAVPGKLITAANKVPHVAAIQSLSDESANLSRENQATRGKMEHLRLIMEERRARRRARREARAAPYTTQWSAKSEQLAPQSGVEPMDTTNSAEQSAPSTTTADVGPPEPVVA
ncbi:midnolin [Schistocerca nitens]|uniref:midnolin n=1 Tax=Schistocerca nitens TaxID=7011 RepID=UPI0021175922|nr:midnolin [Schistocerca nitens]